MRVLSTDSQSIHRRARSVLPASCTFADESCYGKLQAALRVDAPVDLIRTDSRGRRYFVGDPLVGYMRLCQSHHARYDAINVGVSLSAKHRSAISASWTPDRRTAQSVRQIAVIAELRVSRVATIRQVCEDLQIAGSRITLRSVSRASEIPYRSLRRPQIGRASCRERV